ncbi:hypothetical protein F4808DRAFT_464530 [Astrocystis sublimbata]|nr:hypothetical protein F4808DRAFT_464530 [Astrocystis sublimbata]
MEIVGSPGYETSAGSPQASRLRQLPGAACEECRRRKLRCDRQKPRSSACETADVACVVPTTKPSRGPKRGYLKALQERVSALEGMLSDQKHAAQSSPPADDAVDPFNMNLSALGDVPNFGPMTRAAEVNEFADNALGRLPFPLDVLGDANFLPSSYQAAKFQTAGRMSIGDVDEGWYASPLDLTDDCVGSLAQVQQDTSPSSHCTTQSGRQPLSTDTRASSEGSSDLALSSLVQSDLDQLYLDRVHEFVPIVHHDSVSKAPTGLRHAIWTLAASASTYHLPLRDKLYDRTRQILEGQDQCSNDAKVVDTGIVQALLLLAVHELMCVGFRRAWLSAGRAFRLIQLDTTWTAPTGPLTSDSTYFNHTYDPQWVEAEERRRTFWFAYCLDRFLSLQNRSRPVFSERVPVRLPCPDLAFRYCQPVFTGCLLDANILTTADEQGSTSSFGDLIVVATVAGRVLSHQIDANLALATASSEDGKHSTPRHSWDSLYSLFSNRMRAFNLCHPALAQERDPMLLFLAMLWHAVGIYLCHSADSTPTAATHVTHTAKAKLSQLVDNSAHEMLGLMNKLAEWSSWKVHPLMNIPLSLFVELLAPRPDLIEAFTLKLNEIIKTTHGLRIFPS